MFFSFHAFAGPDSELLKKVLESQGGCENFVKYDDHFVFLGLGPAVGVAPLDGSPAFQLLTNDTGLDMLTAGSTAYILTTSAVEEWNLDTRTRRGLYPTSTVTGSLAYMQHAQSFARDGNRLIIAHGRLGISVFDMQTKTIAAMIPLLGWQLPYESMAMGIAISGRTAYIGMDNFHLGSLPSGQPVFHGVITMDLDSMKVTSEMTGLDIGVTDMLVDSKVLIANYGGLPIWKYSLSSIKGGPALPEPVRRVFNSR